MLSEMSAFLEALSAHGARVATVTTMHPQDVSLHVAVPGKQLQADPASVLISDVDSGKFRIVIVLLILVGLKHDATFNGLVAVSAGVRGVQVFVIGCAGKVVHGFGHDRILLIVLEKNSIKVIF
jgi:hypothetical protein